MASSPLQYRLFRRLTPKHWKEIILCSTRKEMAIYLWKNRQDLQFSKIMIICEAT